MNKETTKYETIQWNQFTSLFKYSFEIPFEYKTEKLSEIRLYSPDDKGNIYLKNDLVIDHNNDYNIVIDGNLIIDGYIEINVSDGIGNFLFINGDLKTDSILLSGYPIVEIKKSITSKNGIVGMYGDDGGYLFVGGEISTPVIFNSFYFNMILKGFIDSIVIDASYGELDTIYKKDNLNEVILDELFENSDLKEMKLYQYIKSGKNILKFQKSFYNKSKIKLPSSVKKSKISNNKPDKSKKDFIEQNEKKPLDEIKFKEIKPLQKDINKKHKKANNKSKSYSLNSKLNIEDDKFPVLEFNTIKKEKKYTLEDVINYIKIANNYRKQGNYLKSIENFDEAIKILDLGKIKSEQNKIYIHYSKLWIYSKLAYNKKLNDSKDYKKLCLGEAKTCLSLIPEDFDIWHFTKEGKFHEEIIRYSTNAIAWYIYENSNNKSSLEDALALIERACSYATTPQTYYIFDTKVRILLKLNREEDAFVIVKKILKKLPNFSDFQDFKNNQRYLDWINYNY
jgi:tetratricopeptide (TPR) repeat protein